MHLLLHVGTFFLIAPVVADTKPGKNDSDLPVTNKNSTDKYRRKFLKKTIIRVKKVAPEADDLQLTNDHIVQPWKDDDDKQVIKLSTDTSSVLTTISTSATSTPKSSSLTASEKDYVDVDAKVLNLTKDKENLKKMMKLLKHSTSTVKPSTSTLYSNTGRDYIDVEVETKFLNRKSRGWNENMKKMPHKTSSSLVTSTISSLTRAYKQLKEENEKKKKGHRNMGKSSNSNKVKIVQYGSYELEEYQVAPMSAEEK